MSDAAKLSRLIECCKGRAANVVQPCVLLSPVVGYSKARRLLQERFGDEYTISEAWIDKLTKGPQLKMQGKDMQDFADTASACVETLKAMDKLNEVDNRPRMVKIVEKLPLQLQNRWRKEAVSKREQFGVYPNIHDLVKFINRVAKELNDPVFGVTSKYEHDDSRGTNPKQRPKKSNSFVVKSERTEKLEKPQNAVEKCLVCGEEHYLDLCPKFQAMSSEQRNDYAKDKQLCFSCLKAGHIIKQCKYFALCGVDGCKGKHHKLLHKQKLVSNAGATDTKPESDQPESGNSCACNAQDNNIALPIVPVKVKAHDGSFVKVCALLDPGSNRTFCSQDLTRRLGIQGQDTSVSLSTLNSEDTISAQKVSLEVKGTPKSRPLYISDVIAIPHFPTLSVPSQAAVEQWGHLGDIQYGNDCGDVSLLIGQDNPHVLRPLEVRHGKDYEPYAVRTALGWAVNGPLGTQQQESSAISNFVYSQRDANLTDQVEAFWRVDGLPHDDEVHMSVDDKRVLDIWDNSVRQEDGHYVLDIPFKQYPPELPNNRIQAAKRLNGLKRRFIRDPELLSKYSDGIKDLVDKGYAEPVTKDTTGPAWYIPHHGVTNPNKPNKLRIVFDCSAEYGGTSLNQQVLQGPDLTNNLLGVLLRFREKPVAVMGDIQSMFHQVRVSPEHRDVLRFLWWRDGNMDGEILEYRMTVHLFGGTWSPSCASYALKRTALDHATEYDASVVNAVLHSFYVDDLLDSVDSDQQAEQLVLDLRTMLASGGFRLTKWISNSSEVLKSIPDVERVSEVQDLDLTQDVLPVQRALGVQWLTSEDLLTIKVKPKDGPITRRGILSTMSSVYDPLGLVSPCILQAKMIFQDEVRTQKDWDDEAEPDNAKKWIKWLEELPVLEQEYQIPRCLVPASFGTVSHAQIHHFCDASNDAYGAVSYLRILNKEGHVHCSFIMSKSRLSPLKALSIPRLELCAAVMAVKMDRKLRSELRLPLQQSVFYTDSQVVLQYIRNTALRLQTFVANRVTTIRDGSSPEQWVYIESKRNPADHASRGLSAKKLVSCQEWKHGPPFLWEHEIQDISPEIPLLPNNDEEVKKAKACATTTFETQTHKDDIIQALLERYSSWYRLKKAVAWIRRFVQYVAKKDVPHGQLQVSELADAEKCIVSYVQKQAYQKELRDLQSGKAVSHSSSLRPLRPVLQDGILRVGGRLNYAAISDEAMNPTLLPNSHHVSELIVRHAHQTQTAHSGKEYVLAAVRERYWIPRTRPLINRVLRSCITCRRLHGRLATQQMAPLPVDRVTPDKPPFNYTGLDVFGTFYVKRGRSQEKRYGCIFTCFTTRAIHIEKLASLDSDSFVNALVRFTARRGNPERIYSDNGTNFVGANKEIGEAINHWNSTMQEHLLMKHIEWRFNPPSSSHMGGVWERQIRTVRKVMNVLLQNQVLDDERLDTLFCEIESVVNGRPLTPVSGDCNDLEPLTPNHLLLLRGCSQVVPGGYGEKDTYRRRWRHVQFIADAFWKRWLKEYLPTLQPRQKWTDIKRNIAEGDIVLIMDEQVPRRTWPLARVMKTFPGNDGLVRSAEVKTRWTTLKRPIHKMCLLEGV